MTGTVNTILPGEFLLRAEDLFLPSCSDGFLALSGVAETSGEHSCASAPLLLLPQLLADGAPPTGGWGIFLEYQREPVWSNFRSRESNSHRACGAFVRSCFGSSCRRLLQVLPSSLARHTTIVLTFLPWIGDGLECYIAGGLANLVFRQRTFVPP